MRKIVLDFPEQFRIGFESARNIKISGKFNKILVCGMGGSALAGEILKIFLKERGAKIKVFIKRNYNLPDWIDKNTLISTVSYSGNTEETISCLKAAKAKKAKIFAISSGGKLQNLSKRYKIPIVLVKKGYPPRLAIGILFSAILKVLINSKIIKDFSREVILLEKKIKPKISEGKGKELAKKIKGRILLIYCPEELEGVARIWKQNFNETAKLPAFFNVFPELNHGEIQSFEDFGRFFEAIFFLDKKSNPRILKRERLTAQIFKGKGVGISFVPFNEKGVLERIFSKILLGLWTSYYLAIFQKKDPLSIETIEEFKRKMKK